MSVSSNNPPIDVEIVQITPLDESVETIPSVDTNTVLPNPVVLSNRGIELALSAHANGRRGLGNPAGFVFGSYQRRPMITGLFDFDQKLYKAHYNEECKKFYDGYDIDPEYRHAFITASTLKVKRLSWGGDSCGILDIPTDDFTNLGGTVHKYLLE